MRIKVYTGGLHDEAPVAGRMVISLEEWMQNNPSDLQHILRSQDEQKVRSLDYFDRLFVADTKDSIYSLLLYFQRSPSEPAIAIGPMVNLMANIHSYPDAASLDTHMQSVVDTWEKRRQEGKPTWPPFVAYWYVHGFSPENFAVMERAAEEAREAKRRAALETNRREEAYTAARDHTGRRHAAMNVTLRFYAGLMVSSQDYERLATDAGVWSKIPAGTRGAFRKNVSEISKDSYRITKGKSLSWLGSHDVWDWCKEQVDAYLAKYPDLPTHMVVTSVLSVDLVEPYTVKNTLAAGYVAGYRWRPQGYRRLELVRDDKHRAFCGVVKLDSVTMPDGRVVPLVPRSYDEAGVVQVEVAGGSPVQAIFQDVLGKDVQGMNDGDNQTDATRKFSESLAELLEAAGANAKAVAWIREHGVSAA